MHVKWNRSTVYTFRVPLSELESEKNKDLANVLDVLHELAFNAKLPTEYVNSERGRYLFIYSFMTHCRSSSK